MKLNTAKIRYPNAVTFTFGDGEALCGELLALVRTGTKTATCGALRSFEGDDQALPKVGRRDIALNWDGTAALVNETLEVSIRRFRDVDRSFALDEGENDSLEEWREDHRRYFERNGGFSQDMALVCERFRLIEAFD